MRLLIRDGSLELLVDVLSSELWIVVLLRQGFSAYCVYCSILRYYEMGTRFLTPLLSFIYATRNELRQAYRNHTRTAQNSTRY